MRILRPALLTACLAALACVPALGQAEPKAKPAMAKPTGPTALLSLAKDSTQLTVEVNGQGVYYAAQLDDLATGGSASLSYRSQLLVNWEYLEAPELTILGATSAKSRYSTAGLDVELKQTLSAGPLTDSYLLNQRYTLSNPGTEAITVPVSRYQDSDLFTGAWEWTDAGYMPAKGKWTYLLSELSPQSSTVTNYVGISLSGGTEGRRVVRDCCGQTEVTAEENGLVSGDADGDGTSDYGNDRAMTQQRLVTVPAGQRVTITAQTLFGHTALSSRADLPTK